MNIGSQGTLQETGFFTFNLELLAGPFCNEVVGIRHPATKTLIAITSYAVVASDAYVRASGNAAMGDMSLLIYS